MQENQTDNFRDVFIYGKAAVTAAFKHRPTAIFKIFLDDSVNKEFAEICSWLAQQHRPYESQTWSELSRMVGNTNHEGIVALTKRPLPPSIKPAMREEWFSAGEKILFVDDVEDQGQLAQIARVAAICGVSRLIVSEKTVPALMSAGAWSRSGGALDLMKIYSTESMPGIMRMMSERYFIVGMVREGGRRIDYGKQLLFPGKIVAFYIGNDEGGVPAGTISRCDYLLHIAEPAGTELRYTPAELATHVLPWIYAKIKKPGVGFLARKKNAQKHA